MTSARRTRHWAAVLVSLVITISAGCFQYTSPDSVIDETRRQFAELRECLGPFPGSVGEETHESEGDVGEKSYFATYALTGEEASTTIATRTDEWWRNRCGVTIRYPADSQSCPTSASYAGMGLGVTLLTDQPNPAVQCASKGTRVRLHARATLPPWP